MPIYKKTLIVIAQALSLMLCYSLVLWLFNVIFDHNTSFEGKILAQGFVFAVLYIPVSWWLDKRMKNNNKQ